MLAAAQDWIKEHKERGIQPVFANPSRQVVRLMRAAGLHDLIGEEFITVRMNDAVLLCQVRAPPTLVGFMRGAAPCGRELHVRLHKAVKLGDAQFAGASWQPVWEAHRTQQSKRVCWASLKVSACVLLLRSCSPSAEAQRPGRPPSAIRRWNCRPGSATACEMQWLCSWQSRAWLARAPRPVTCCFCRVLPHLGASS